jgi:DNA (cytosine-5)-methyltransferase 1
VGNSVPPLLGKAVASKVVECIGAQVEEGEPKHSGDVHLLELNMSQAAEYFGVSSTVIPQRIRKATSDATNA